MQTVRRRLMIAVMATVLLVVVGLAASALAQTTQSLDQRVAALKASLQENQARLRKYEWIETTSISLKGEEKSRRQQRCYYGADGKMQKLPLESGAPQAAPSAAGGRRGGKLRERVVENKKDEMQDYMERAVALVHKYLPPDPAQIQQALEAKKVALKPLPDSRTRLEFSGYLQPNDSFVIDIDGAANQLGAISLATYLEKPDDPVTLSVKFRTLADGTSYVAETILDAKAKNIRVVIENSGYRSVAR